MKFGDVVIDQAEGAVLAHALVVGTARMPKGHVLVADDIALIAAHGIAKVIVAIPGEGDLLEDEAARRVAGAIAPDHLRIAEAATGRVNIFATVNGLFRARREIVDAVNRVDPAITLATLKDTADVKTGDMVATIKIIPLAASGTAVEEAAALLRGATAFEVKPYTPRRVALIATELPSLKLSVMDKTRRLTDQRLSASASRIMTEYRVAHRTEAVAKAIGEAVPLHDMLILFGASAVTDPADVLPESIRLAGGTVSHVGLPVDPGNLLVLGEIDGKPVIGAPGCARSPKENAFDWILSRILAGEKPTYEELTGLGVGGLLMEIPTRPRPRLVGEEEKGGLHVGAVILAAGQASRMAASGSHKLLAEFDGVPLVKKSVQSVLAGGVDEAVMVTGYRAGDIRAALGDMAGDPRLSIVDNRDYASGMASSLRTGLRPLRGHADGVLVMLADMPGISADDLRKLVEAFRTSGGEVIIRAVFAGKRGNPVILPKATFDAISKLEGDIGARPVIEKSGLEIIDIDIGAAAHLDTDTPEAILAAGGVLKA
jgi:molybdenum cofactor cytidylyltransferase